MYTQDGVVILGAIAKELGAITRETGVGPWQAWRLHIDKDNELLGEFDSVEDAQRAVEDAIPKE